MESVDNAVDESTDTEEKPVPLAEHRRTAILEGRRAAGAAGGWGCFSRSTAPAYPDAIDRDYPSGRRTHHRNTPSGRRSHHRDYPSGRRAHHRNTPSGDARAHETAGSPPGEPYLTGPARRGRSTLVDALPEGGQPLSPSEEWPSWQSLRTPICSP
ncbi:hypothetical protein DKT74_38125 [Streptomyces sp. ZEA17I]|nr:hypothetical protein DKT74_38125 [Streptomyces sp. ZEA17I]